MGDLFEVNPATGGITASGIQTTASDDFVVTCGANKTLRLTEPVWDDLRVPMNSAHVPASNPPTLVKFKDDGASSVGVFTWSFADQALVGDEEQLVFNAQLPHKYREGTDLVAHIHWSPSATGGSDEFVKWGLEYTWQNVNGTFDDTTIITTDASSASTATTAGGATLSGFQHYVSHLGTISGVDKDISSMLICRVFRNSSHGDDDLAQSVFAFEIDFHFEVDTMGSRQAFIK